MKQSGESRSKAPSLLREITAVLESGKRPERVLELAQALISQVQVNELQNQTPQAIAAALRGLHAFVAVRQPGELLVRVFNPDRDRDGWQSQHTIIEMANDDMPFLVDTTGVVMAELGIGVHANIHPILQVERDRGGRVRHYHSSGTGKGGTESVMQLQVDRQTDPAMLERIETGLRQALADVRLAVADWEAMLLQAEGAVTAIGEWARVCDPEVVAESREFLGWLMRDHFTFFGSRDYEMVRVGKSSHLKVVKGSGLGILRESKDTVHSRPIATLSESARRNRDNPLIITKTRQRGRIHRPGYMDYIGVLRFDARGRTVGERRFIGLFTSTAYFRRTHDTPLVRQKTDWVLENSQFRPGSHAHKSLAHILETLPRDELFQATPEELRDLALGVLDLQERKRVRLLVRRERFNRYFSCLVYIPRDRFNTENRARIQALLFDAYAGEHLDYQVQVSDAAMAMLHVVIRSRPGSEPHPDVKELEQQIAEAVRSWHDVLRDILVEKFGEAQGLAWTAGIVHAFPAAYVEDVSPWVASFDVEKLAALGDENDLRMSLYRPRAGDSDIIRFKLFKRGAPIPLSTVLPMLESLGLLVQNERPYQLHLANGEHLWVQDYDMLYAHGERLELNAVRDSFQEAFENSLRGVTATDNFNRLVLAAQLHWRQVMLLRAYCKYLLQTRIPFSLAYMADTLARHPLLARLLVELFDAQFNPAFENEDASARAAASQQLRQALVSLLPAGSAPDKVLQEYLAEAASARAGSQREPRVASLQQAFKRRMLAVSSLDEDRILNTFLRVIECTLRTNFYQHDAEGRLHDCFSFKLDSAAVPNLPRPLPYREIWVYSARFEGIHLRGGPIARGGLRWSDRKEDFRTEVLGLMKAQSVKNTMIVPVGAKGGFVPLRIPGGAGRDAVMAEGTQCYISFINRLLDITDNLDDKKVLPPPEVVRRDGDDPYLVVAADKGTATFSDTANRVALARGFWLGDAFASGGSVGYDHKGMGITAKGAWEGVKRHFREMGRDIQKQEFTVVGIGDMSGDVFGNGMLLSRKIRLQAAFNHQHIFLDPDPDAETSFRERKRLFRLPRSGWSDYDPKLISRGGGVFSRRDKTVPISREIRAWLGIEAEELAPHELISKLLTAEVDLLWNGGIGTYVKASTQSHADVGDQANDALRVNGNELRCRVVGEGGNLGFTQLGRVEYARAGGRINTDFIDNSAGVDCSDHEVNIKILLNLALRTGELDEPGRKELLAAMTEEVGQLVVRSNYLQTQAISMMERLKGPRLGAKQRFISVLESEGQLDRALEYLPDDEELTERRIAGDGLTRPELSVLLSYSKIRLYGQLLDSDIPEDRFLSAELGRYFPEPLRERFSHLMEKHRLKREIIATQVTNSLVNRMGASFVLRMRDDTGVAPAEVARSYTVARELLDARSFWAAIEALDGKVDSALQIDAQLIMWNQMRAATRWLANLPGRLINIEWFVKRLKPGLDRLVEDLAELMDADDRVRVAEIESKFQAGGFPRKLASRTANLHLLPPLLDVVEIAADRRQDVRRVADVYLGLGRSLGLKWLRDQVENLRVESQWHASARANLRDELFEHHRALTLAVMASAGPDGDPVARWASQHADDVQWVTAMLDDMRKLSQVDYAIVAVAVRALGQLLSATRVE